VRRTNALERHEPAQIIRRPCTNTLFEGILWARSPLGRNTAAERHARVNGHHPRSPLLSMTCCGNCIHHTERSGLPLSVQAKLHTKIADLVSTTRPSRTCRQLGSTPPHDRAAPSRAGRSPLSICALQATTPAECGSCRKQGESGRQQASFDVTAPLCNWHQVQNVGKSVRPPRRVANTMKASVFISYRCPPLGFPTPRQF
jgi:hypothetical protein